MDARRHAQLSRRLIAACGGVDEIVRSQACRVQATQLYRFREPASGFFMPADVMAHLEAYCGEAIYSSALAEARPTAPDARSPELEACELTEAAAALQRVVRLAVADHRLTEAEVRQIEAALAGLEHLAARLRAATTRGRC